MISVVLDANVALDWFIPSAPAAQYSAPLVSLALDASVRFHVPAHFDVEVVGQLVRHHRRSPTDFSEKWLNTALGVLDSLPIDTHAIGVNFEVLGNLCKAYNITAYDVPYLHLARMLEYPIASRDRGVLSACKAWNVDIWQPGL